MDKSLYAPFIFRLNGDHVAVAAHGNDPVLQKLLFLAREIGGEAGADFLARQSDLPPKGVQPVAGAVGNFVLAQNLLRDFLFQPSVLGKHFGKRAHFRRATVRKAVHRFAAHPRRPHELAQLQQFPAGKRRALFRALRFVAEGRKILHRARAQLEQQQGSLLRKIEQALRGKPIRFRLRPQNFLPRSFEHGEGAYRL